MQTYLAVFTTFHAPGAHGAYNMVVALDGAPTASVIRELEATMKEAAGARTATLTNLIPLAGGVDA